MSTFAIVGIICVVVFIYVIVKGKQEHKELQNIQQTTKDYLEYNADKKTIKLFKRHPSLEKQFSFEEIAETFTTHHKEKQRFTGVSVGPVVTGSIKTVGGDKTHTRGSGTYFFMYNVATNFLDLIEKEKVYEIELTDELRSEAIADSRVSAYLKGNVIKVYDGGFPNYAKCKAIRDWISAN